MSAAEWIPRKWRCYWDWFIARTNQKSWDSNLALHPLPMDSISGPKVAFIKTRPWMEEADTTNYEIISGFNFACIKTCMCKVDPIIELYCYGRHYAFWHDRKHDFVRELCTHVVIFNNAIVLSWGAGIRTTWKGNNFWVLPGYSKIILLKNGHPIAYILLINTHTLIPNHPPFTLHHICIIYKLWALTIQFWNFLCIYCRYIQHD